MKHRIFCHLAAFVSIASILSGCAQGTGDQSSSASSQQQAGVTQELFGNLPDGREVLLFTLTNGKGFTVKAINYGGIITSILAPDKDGNTGDVVLGFDSLDRYAGRHPHMGPLIGRYSGYIAGAKFSIDGVDYNLGRNSGENHLHGGPNGFDKALWDASIVDRPEGAALQLQYTSPDGEEGYPGNLKTTVTYVVTPDNSLQITYEAETDKKTHVNLTNHLYFNLSGMKSANVMDHELMINASHFAVPGKGNIPTGELRSVQGTALDFRSPTRIGARINDQPGLYDHNYVLKPENDTELLLAATVHEPKSGRFMEVFTTHTGLEFASANWLKVKGKDSKDYGRSAGFLLYPQHLPDSPNRPDFPSTLLTPGERYTEKTIYKFSVQQ